MHTGVLMYVSRQTDESVFKSHFTQANDGWWVARDEETGVASQGETRQNAHDNLNEAVALHKGEIGKSIDSSEEEEKVLDELGIDPDEVAQARDEHDGLPEFLQVELPNGAVITLPDTTPSEIVEKLVEAGYLVTITPERADKISRDAEKAFNEALKRYSVN